MSSFSLCQQKDSGKRFKIIPKRFLFFPALIHHCSLVPLFPPKTWKDTEQIAGPRFHTKLHSSWGCRVEGEDGWKWCSVPGTWLTSCQDYCLYMQWKGLFKNLEPNVMPRICACWGFFVCHEKCDTTLPFLKLFYTGKPLSAKNKPQSFEFTSLHVCFFFLNSSSFTTLLLNFCFTRWKSQDTAVSGNATGFFWRQMGWWLL